jgi:hypothetical protein
MMHPVTNTVPVVGLTATDRASGGWPA